MTQHKAAFLRIWHIPYANQTVADILQRAFSDIEIEVIDVLDLLKRRKPIMAKNLLHLAREYGLDIVRGLKKPKRSFFTTTYVIQQMNQLIQQALEQEPYLFTFQMQSLFNGQTGNKPHFVYTDHTMLAHLDYPLDIQKRTMLSASWLQEERLIYKRATITFTRSQHIKRSLINQYGLPPRQVQCVFAGPNVPIEQIEIKEGRYQEKNILFVGVEWERKGGPQLVEAFRQVQQIYPDATLTIIGYEPKVNLPNCRVLGKLPLAELPKHFKEATIFCLPTKLEPFGVVFVEAMNYGLPIVATNVGAIPDFVSNANGRLVPPNDIPALTHALLTVLEGSKLRTQMGQNSLKLAQERYNWEKVGQQMRESIVPHLTSQNCLVQSSPT